MPALSSTDFTVIHGCINLANPLNFPLATLWRSDLNPPPPFFPRCGYYVGDISPIISISPSCYVSKYSHWAQVRFYHPNSSAWVLREHNRIDRDCNIEKKGKEERKHISMLMWLWNKRYIFRQGNINLYPRAALMWTFWPTSEKVTQPPVFSCKFLCYSRDGAGEERRGRGAPGVSWFEMLQYVNEEETSIPTCLAALTGLQVTWVNNAKHLNFKFVWLRVIWMYQLWMSLLIANVEMDRKV